MMSAKIEITFTHMDVSPTVEAKIRNRIAKLETLFDGITNVHVAVAAPHKRAGSGNIYDVHLAVHVPGTELVVNERPGKTEAHTDVYVAVRDAFNAIERQLKRWKDQIRGEVKTHDMPLQGRVADLHREEGYGEIATVDGRLVYFHRNSVLNGGFDALRPDATVELTVQSGESAKGPQASTVRPIGPMRFVAAP